ncbi:MAG: aldo/keto reductase [Clostridia bacterium]
MKTIPMAQGALNASEIVLGCMRIKDMALPAINKLVNTAIDCGINFFDHSDVYTAGKCEQLFADAMKFTAAQRENVITQTKCGIRKEIGGYDFSKEYILTSVENSLKRLATDYIDVLLLHRPDPLFEPEEVAEAFRILHDSGKVRHFGVSNVAPYQCDLLAKYMDQPLVVNQLQFSLMHTGMIDAAMNVNTRDDQSIDRDGDILDYCRLHDITVQAWSPIQYGFFKGIFLDNPEFPELNAVLNRMAEEKGVSNSAIALAWILRHPARMQVIIGTTNEERVKVMARASGVEMSRKEWFELYRAAGNRVL